MISLKNIELRMGAKLLIENSSLIIQRGKRLGVIGVNGCGKSSLFSLILGKTHCDAGDVDVPQSLRVSHMAQEIEALEQKAIDYVIDGDVYLRSLEKQVDEALEKEDYQKLSQLYELIESHDGYTAKSRAEQLLHGLGFNQKDVEKTVREFSGGWRMRLNLARTLMCPSDLMLLDEPTNHLDIEAIIWLESWLCKYMGTLMLISHDRNFLDNVTNQIVHIENKQITHYIGNYTAFEKAQAEKIKAQQATYEKQQRKIKHIHSFVDRFRAKATKAKQAQSRLKALERIELVSAAHVNSGFSFAFESSEKISNPLVSVNQAALGYNDTALLKNVNFSFHPESRIALLGPNGSGKSTLIKALIDQKNFIEGGVVIGEHTKIGYFAQHQIESLDLKASAFTHVLRISPSASDQKIRDFLGKFNFHGDRIFEAIENFSGGECARVSLALIAWQKPNLLLLDEPTNHLDLEVRHALEVALLEFKGAVLLVSHDRSLIDAVTNEFWLLQDNKIIPFEGDLDDYIKLRKQKSKDETERKTKKNSVAIKNNKKQTKSKKPKDSGNIQYYQKKIKQCEQNINAINKELQAIELQLQDPENFSVKNQDKVKQLANEQKRQKKHAK